MSTATAATKKKSTKAAASKKATKPAASHPSWLDMIKECVVAHPEESRSGVSRPTIKKFVETKYKIEINATATSQLNRAIATGVEKGNLVLPKGASGKVKLAPKVRPDAAKENAKPVAKKPTATAAKAPAKKPTAKATSPKAPLKKAGAMHKKATTTKKTTSGKKNTSKKVATGGASAKAKAAAAKPKSKTSAPKSKTAAALKAPSSRVKPASKAATKPGSTAKGA